MIKGRREKERIAEEVRKKEREIYILCWKMEREYKDTASYQYREGIV